MNYLKTVLSKEEIDEIYDTFNIEAINNLNDENVYNIISYLKNENVDFIEDILVFYLDLFLYDFDVFKERFEKIKLKYGENYIDLIGKNMQILEEME